MKGRIAIERLSKVYIARCGYTWLDESNWPQEWPISPITIVYLKIPSEKMKSLCLYKTGKDDLACPMIRKLSSVYVLAHSGFVSRCCPMTAEFKPQQYGMQ